MKYYYSENGNLPDLPHPEPKLDGTIYEAMRTAFTDLVFAPESQAATALQAQFAWLPFHMYDDLELDEENLKFGVGKVRSFYMTSPPLQLAVDLYVWNERMGELRSSDRWSSWQEYTRDVSLPIGSLNVVDPVTRNFEKIGGDVVLFGNYVEVRFGIEDTLARDRANQKALLRITDFLGINLREIEKREDNYCHGTFEDEDLALFTAGLKRLAAANNSEVTLHV